MFYWPYRGHSNADQQVEEVADLSQASNQAALQKQFEENEAATEERERKKAFYALEPCPCLKVNPSFIGWHSLWVFFFSCGRGSTPTVPFGVGAPPFLEPILVGIGPFKL